MRLWRHRWRKSRCFESNVSLATSVLCDMFSSDFVANTRARMRLSLWRNRDAVAWRHSTTPPELLTSQKVSFFDFWHQRGSISGYYSSKGSRSLHNMHGRYSRSVSRLTRRSRALRDSHLPFEVFRKERIEVRQLRCCCFANDDVRFIVTCHAAAIVLTGAHEWRALKKWNCRFSRC